MYVSYRNKVNDSLIIYVYYLIIFMFIFFIEIKYKKIDILFANIV